MQRTITEEKINAAVESFIYGGMARQGERFGAFFCRIYQVCDPMVARQPDDAIAYDWLVRKYIKQTGFALPNTNVVAL